MKLYTSLLCALLVLAAANLTAQQKTIEDKQYVRSNGTWYILDPHSDVQFAVDMKVITVKFKEGSSKAQQEALIDRIGGTVLRANRLGYIDIEVSSRMDVFDAVQSCLNDAMIQSAETNATGEYVSTPNDTDFSLQYSLDQPSDADIDAPEAWKLETGSPDIIIGILDSGTDFAHEDLGMGADPYQNIYLNSGEDAWIIPDDPTTGNGIDDDGNGLIDDWKGWDFNNGNNDSRGPFYHGTHVAGIVAAKTNNIIGIAGIAGGFKSAGSQMLIVGVGDFAPNTAIMDDAILYAADMGVHIIQLSLTVPQTTAIDEALESAYNDNNVLVVCAAGNTGSGVTYPARDPHVMAISASDASDQIAGFSARGMDIENAAAGVAVYSTQIGNTYGSANGTSFAAPIVSGVAALIFSVEPCLSNDEVRTILHLSAEKVGGYNYNWDPARPGHSQEFGYGRVNAHQAVLLAMASSGNNYIQNATFYEENHFYAMNKLAAGQSVTSATTTGPVIVASGGDVSFRAGQEICLENGFSVAQGGDFTAFIAACNALPKRGVRGPLPLEEPVAGMPTSGQSFLAPNFPNPFSATTRIEYYVHEAAPVSLTVRDMFGRSIAELVRTDRHAQGSYSVQFDSGDLAAGTYTYTLRVGDTLQSRTMILMK